MTRGAARPGRASATPRRWWTRVGTAGACAHVFYELAAGVGMPYASRLGPGPAAALYGAGTVVVYRAAGRRPSSSDRAFAVVNGLYLSAVLAHFAGWPRTTAAGLPWLTECEGLRGRMMPPYNVILYVSGIAALGGLVENRRGALWGAALPGLLVPWLVREQRREFARLQCQARQRPGWWNRRLRPR